LVRDRLLARLDVPDVTAAVREQEQAVRTGERTPDQAARAILAALDARGWSTG